MTVLQQLADCSTDLSLYFTGCFGNLLKIDVAELEMSSLLFPSQKHVIYIIQQRFTIFFPAPAVTLFKTHK